MASISKILISHATVAAQAGIRYRILGCYLSVRNTAGTTCIDYSLAFTEGGATKKFLIDIVPSVAGVSAMTFNVPEVGILTDVNTAMTFAYTDAPTAAQGTVIYQEVTE